MKTITIILSAAALALATGCGSTSTAASGETESTSNEDAPIEWARCMRENGVDVPDPQVDDEGRMRILVGGPGQGVRPDDPKVQAAMKECGSILRAMRNGGKAPSAEDRARFQEQALKFAQCMREHGVDMPDPQFDEGGGVMQVGPKPGSRDTAKFREAAEACRDLLPGPRGDAR